MRRYGPAAAAGVSTLLQPSTDQQRVAVQAKPRPMTSLMASASRLTSEALTGRRWSASNQDWQEDAWDMLDLVGEQRFLANTLASRLSQARLYVGRLTGDNLLEEPDPVEDPVINGVLEALGGSPTARSQMMKRLSVNLFVPGEGWLVGIPAGLLPAEHRTREPREDWQAGDDLFLDDLEWRMLSTSEVSTTPLGMAKLKFAEKVTVEVSPDDLYLIRVWSPHPRRAWEADSPTRSSLPVLRELVGLTMHISAQVDSRLAGAGVFIVPASASKALKIAAGMDENSNEDPFTDALIEAMMTPINDRSSAAALVPLVVTVPDEATDKFEYINFSSNLDTEARQLRDEAIRRLALGQDAPPELLLGIGCVDMETEALTRRGWLRGDELVEGDVVLTLNHGTGRSEWQPVHTMNRFQVENHPMLRMQGIGHDSLTTLDHRWPVLSANHDRREFVTSGNLNSGHLVPTAAPHDDFPEATYSDAFVELVAWWWTEGSYSKGTPGDPSPYGDSIGRHYSNGHPQRAAGRWGQAAITQSHERNPGNVEAIRGALAVVGGDKWGREYQRTAPTGYGGAAVTRFALRQQVWAELEAVAPGKIVSTDFVRSLTRAQLELFIQTSCAGDGWHYSDGRLDIWQRNPAALEAYELALILSGRMVAHSEHAGGHVVNPYRKSTIRPIKAGIDRLEEYTGTVWCPTVENGTWLARRSGTVWFTGNSMNHWGAWLVREDVVSTHIEPPLALICDALTTQYLRPALESLGVEDAEEYVIWYDVSHMIARPNRATDAQALHDKGVLSDEAVRAANGFDDTDAPTDIADPALEVVLRMVGQAPSLAADPGIPALVEQVRDALAGRTPEGGNVDGEVVPVPGGDTAAPADGIPATDGDPAPAVAAAARPVVGRGVAADFLPVEPEKEQGQ